MERTLKDILKPPFSHCGTPCGHVGVSTIDYRGKESWSRLLDVRGWGYFQYFENGEQLQDEFKEFVIQALNNEWERQYGEPKRWYVVGDYDNCPSCKMGFCKYYVEAGIYIHPYNYCPSCGQRLLPPEGI